VGKYVIKISDEIHDALCKFGESHYPHECCGMLLGKLGAAKEKTVEDLLPISNAREQKDKHNRFLITPDEFMRGEMHARRKKLDIVGFYHSHPDHPSKPSEYDREHAWPFYSYIIISVAKGVADVVTSWVLSDDRLLFNPERIVKGE
jgi:proteasome lid subunit RPN8/RPN11